jgi:hypothetical protein
MVVLERRLEWAGAVLNLWAIGGSLPSRGQCHLTVMTVRGKCETRGARLFVVAVFSVTLS